MRRYNRSHLKLRNGAYYTYSRRVPTPLVGLVGKRAWVKYLGKLSPAQAAIHARELDVETDRRIAKLTALPPADRQAIAAGGGFDSFETSVNQAVESLPFRAVFAHYKEADVELDDDDALEQLREIREANALIARTNGQRQLVDQLKTDGKTSDLASLIDVYKRVSPPRNMKRIETLSLYVRRFVNIVGDIKVADIRRVDVIKFRSGLEAEGKTRTLVKAHLSAIHRLFVIAVSEGIVDANPAAGVLASKGPPVKYSATKAKKSFTSDQVRRILDGAAKLHADRHWIIRLLAYHGARSGEIVQLRPSDITTIDGIPVIRITDEDGDIKNEFSLRDVPIHPACMDIVAYANAASEARHALLFHGFTKAKDRKAAFQGAGRRFLDSVGIADKKLTMHTLRHTWKTRAIDMDMPEPVRKAIMGHSEGDDEHAGYGEGPTLVKRAEWMVRTDPLK